jgi:uncharacterized membrane protein
MSSFFGFGSEDIRRGAHYLYLSFAFFIVSALLLITRPKEVHYFPLAILLIVVGTFVLLISIWNIRKEVKRRKSLP